MSNRWSLDQRIQTRNRNNLVAGMPAGWADEALDLYLVGESPAEIARCFDVSYHHLYDVICKAALYRLMKSRGVDRLDEVPDVRETGVKLPKVRKSLYNKRR